MLKESVTFIFAKVFKIDNFPEEYNSVFRNYIFQNNIFLRNYIILYKLYVKEPHLNSNSRGTILCCYLKFLT